MWSVWLVFCDCSFHSVCPLIRIRGLWKLPDGRDWLWGKLGLVPMGRVMLSKSLIQFYFEGLGSVPSLSFDLRPNYGGGNENNGDLLQKVPCMHCHTQCPRPCSRPPLTHTSTRDSWTLMGKSRSVSCGVTAPFSWSWCAQGFEQCKEIEENDGMGKTRDLFKKTRDTQGNISCKDGLNKGQKWYGPNRSRRYSEEVARIHRRTLQKRSSLPR